MSLTVLQIRTSTTPSSNAGTVARGVGVTFRSVEPAERLTAVRAATTTHVVLIDDHVTIDSGTLAAIARSENTDSEIIGGRAHLPTGDSFGVMLAPERFGPFPFRLTPMLSLPREQNVASLFKGEIDVVASGLVVVSRSLFIELEGFDPLFEGVYALSDLCLRARACGAVVRCDPTIVFTRDRDDRAPRRPYEAMSELSARHRSFATHHEPLGVRKRGISREVRLAGGVRMRLRKPVPPVSIVVHGAPPADVDALFAAIRENMTRVSRLVWADPLAPHANGIERSSDPVDALRERMLVRGDQYVGLVRSDAQLTPGWLDALIETLEWGSDVAIAVADRAEPTTCALVTMRLVPQHVELTEGRSLQSAFAEFSDRLVALRRGTRALDGTLAAPPILLPHPSSASVIFIAGSKPEIVRSSFEALLGQTGFAKEYLAVIPQGAETTRVLLSSYPRVRIVPDGIDPGLSAGLNAAFSLTTGDRVFVTSDEYLFSPDTIPALFSAFDRVPGLGMAAPRTNGSLLPQGINEASYVDLMDMQRYAAERLSTFRRELTFVDRVTTVAFVIDRHVVASIGGVDERFGLNRFAIEDLSLRALAAGYRVAMCDDVFAHRHAVEYCLTPIGHADEDQTLWNAFRRKWSLPNGAIGQWKALPIVEAGFDPRTRRIPLRETASQSTEPRPLAAVFIATIDDEAGWPAASDVIRQMFKAFDADDAVTLLLAVRSGGPSLAELGYRLRKLLTALDIAVERSMDVEIVPLTDDAVFVAQLPEAPQSIVFGARTDAFSTIPRATDRSRESLRHFLTGTVNAQ